MIVGGLQMDIAWEDPEESFRRAEALADRAAAAGARLLVLPELFATGFSMNAELVAASGEAALQLMTRLARRHRVWVVGGFAESAGDRPYNACAVVDPDGEERARYRKIHPFSLTGEQSRYRAGETVANVAVDGLRVTPLICYDLRFPELFRATADVTDLYLVIANWPEPRTHAWSALLVARAIDCQAWVVGVNRVGDAQGHRHLGESVLVDPLGRVVARGAHQPAVVMGEVDAATVASVRDRYGFLRDRRPGVYASLMAPPVE